MDAGIPELNGLNLHWIRIPAELDVAVSPRVMAVLDTPAVQRLKQISQLGLVSHVYPGAVHSRFEHSLGVYRLACLSLQQLLRSEPEFASRVSADDLKLFLLAALLHDVGHWPYCHPIEDLAFSEFPRHESLARSLICSSPLADVIREQWQIAPQQVSDFIASADYGGNVPVLRNLLNGPVDIDKMDYLQRDSLHAGVPYGRNFDVGRLISSLCVGPDGSSIALTQKGKTAAEMMVFARYVMFSEVYWHHTVRSATAMLQRLVYGVRQRCTAEAWLWSSDAQFAADLSRLADDDVTLTGLAKGLFGQQRALYKRLAQFTFSENPQVFAALARRPYPQLVQAAELLGQRLSRNLAKPLGSTDLLIDAPPVKLEVQFRINVGRNQPSAVPREFVSLADVSPVVRSLATEQFDNFVKRVRIFIAPHRLPDVAPNHPSLADDLAAVAEQLPKIS